MVVRTLLSLLFLVVIVGTRTAVADDRPNIILIMADDFGYECVTANGGESYKTPNLDGLAESGMRFDQCYVQPLCTPTRIQLMTGLYNSRNYFQFGRIDPKATTFANLLRDAGYATAIAGKWQLGTAPDLPQRLGFDESCLWQHTRRPSRYANPGLEYNGEPKDFTNGEYGPDLVNDFALEFIEQHQDGPFLLYYPMILTHGPFVPTPDSAEYDPQARSEQEGKDNKHFADMVTYADKLVGKVAAKLDELGIRDNTLIIFLGDNGTGKGINTKFKGENYPGGKGQTNARGMHVPLIVNWPGRVPVGVDGNLVGSTDFLPTLCQAAGVELPADMPPDGQSFYAQMVGQRATPRESLYTWYGRSGGPSASHEFAQTTTSKLYSGGRYFDLASDPFEEHPLLESELTSEHAAAAAKLRGVIDQFKDARPEELRSRPAVPMKGELKRKGQGRGKGQGQAAGKGRGKGKGRNAERRAARKARKAAEAN